MIAAALPYFAFYRIGPIQSYGVLLLAALVLGGLATTIAARRRAIDPGEAIALSGVCVGASVIGAHLFDVLATSGPHPAPLWQFWQGVSLTGATIAIAIVTLVWTHVRRLPLAQVADCIALGWLVALVIGRIGCALVHDHVGGPTSLPIGIDFPRHELAWRGYPDAIGPMRLHDLGFEELLVAIGLAAVIWPLSRRLKPGMTAAITALAYAPIRFALDFQRNVETDPRFASLTAAQWGCIAMAGFAIYGLARRRLP